MFGEIVMIGFGVFIISFSIYIVYRGIITKRFKKTEGKIISSELNIEYGDDEADYEPLIHYEYIIEGKKYQNSKFSVSPKRSKREVEKIISENKPGKVIEIFYNPKKPNDSVIQAGMSVKNYLGIVVIVLLLLIALIKLLFL